MRHQTIRSLLILACLALCSTAVAQTPADSPSAPAPADSPGAAAPATDADRAVELFRQANEHYKEDRYAEAAPLYEQAWELAKTYDIAANYGHTAYHLQDYRKAAELLSFALSRWPQTGHTPARQAAEDRLKEVRQHVAAVKVSVSVPGAEVSLDGTVVGTAPLETELFLDAGPHTIAAQLSGYQSASESLEAEAGATVEVMLTLVEPSGGPVGPGPDEPRAEPLPLWPVFVGGGVALALAGVGVAFRIIGGNQQEDADATRDTLRAELAATGASCPSAPGCSDLESMYADADSSLNTSTGLFIAGGAAALATVVYAVLVAASRQDTEGAAEPTAETALTVTPIAGPGLIGAGASVRF